MSQTIKPKTLSKKALHDKQRKAKKLAVVPLGLGEWIDFANMVPGSVPLPAHGQDFVQFLDERFPRAQFPAFRDLLDTRVDGLRGLAVPSSGLGLGVPSGENAELRYNFYIRAVMSRTEEARAILRTIAGGYQRGSFPWGRLSQWPIDLVKICEYCGRVFFASRRDRLTCSSTCAVNRRNREWRKHKSQYKESRIRNGGMK